jgi:hypothetical protein
LLVKTMSPFFPGNAASDERPAASEHGREGDQPGDRKESQQQGSLDQRANRGRSRANRLGNGLLQSRSF